MAFTPFSEQPPYGFESALRIQMLGGFRTWRDSGEIPLSAWKREKALHLFQFFLTVRGRYLHKEQIIDRLWPELDLETGGRDFRVSMNAIYKTLEPERGPRAQSRFFSHHVWPTGSTSRRCGSMPMPLKR